MPTGMTHHKTHINGLNHHNDFYWLEVEKLHNGSVRDSLKSGV